MIKAYLRTGQAAKELQTSSHHIRRLCEAGLIEDAELTGAQQWRIPTSEVQRLSKEGLPPIPTGAEPRNNSGRNGNGHSHTDGLLGPPSDDLIDSSEEVKKAENRVKKRRLDLEAEQIEDEFREREQTAAERQAAQEAAEKAEQTRAAAAQNRRWWTERWTDYALERMPYDAPPAIRLDVTAAVAELLESRDPNEPSYTTQRLLDAAIARAGAPWQRTKEIDQAVKEACSKLPLQMQWADEWKYRAIQAARETVARLTDRASYAEMEAAATLALKALRAEYEHRKRCKEAVEGVWQLLPGGSCDVWEDAKGATRETLAELPIGATERQIAAAIEKALEPIRAKIAERQDQETRQTLIREADWKLWGVPEKAKEKALVEIREAVEALPEGTDRGQLESARDRVIERVKRWQERREQKQQLIEAGLREIYPYLQRLEQEWEFDKSLWTLEQELEPAIREALQEELEGDESPEDVTRRVKQLVRQELEL